MDGQIGARRCGHVDGRVRKPASLPPNVEEALVKLRDVIDDEASNSEGPAFARYSLSFEPSDIEDVAFWLGRT